MERDSTSRQSRIACRRRDTFTMDRRRSTDDSKTTDLKNEKQAEQPTTIVAVRVPYKQVRSRLFIVSLCLQLREWVLASIGNLLARALSQECKSSVMMSLRSSRLCLVVNVCLLRTSVHGFVPSAHPTSVRTKGIYKDTSTFLSETPTPSDK